MTGISHCYHDVRGTLALSGSDFTVDFKAAILAPDLPNLKEDKDYTKKDLDGIDGKGGKPIVLTEMKNDKIYAVSKTYFEQHIEGKVKLPEILEILRDNGILLSDGPGKILVRYLIGGAVGQEILPKGGQTKGLVRSRISADIESFLDFIFRKIWPYRPPV